MSDEHEPEDAWPVWFEGLAMRLSQPGPTQPTATLDGEPIGPHPLLLPEPFAMPTEPAPGIIFEDEDDE